MTDELEGFTPEQIRKLKETAETYLWTFGDEVDKVAVEMFDRLVNSSGGDLKGLGKTTFSRHVPSPDEKSQIVVNSEAQEVDGEYFPKYVDMILNSQNEDEAFNLFGVFGYTDLSLRMFPGGGLVISGRVLDEANNERMSILFNSGNIETNRNEKPNTHSPSEAMDLVRNVSESFAQFSTAPKHV